MSTRTAAYRYKVRFHLAKGPNFMKWKVEGPQGTKFYDPESTQLVLHNIRLRNQKTGAQKIFDGANKFVVAWVDAGRVEVSTNPKNPTGAPVSYNPRKAPNWVMGGKNVDGHKFPMLVSKGRGLFLPGEDRESSTGGRMSPTKGKIRSWWKQLNPTDLRRVVNKLGLSGSSLPDWTPEDWHAVTKYFRKEYAAEVPSFSSRRKGFLSRVATNHPEISIVAAPRPNLTWGDVQEEIEGGYGEVLRDVLEIHPHGDRQSRVTWVSVDILGRGKNVIEYAGGKPTKFLLFNASEDEFDRWHDRNHRHFKIDRKRYGTKPSYLPNYK